MMEIKDKVITILLERISDLEFEVEKLNNIIEMIRERAFFEETNAESLSDDIFSIINEKLKGEVIKSERA